MSNIIKYVKHNKVRFKSLEDRDKGTRMFTDFFSSIRKEEVGKEMRGHMILDSTSDLTISFKFIARKTSIIT
jgi:hypothetical protein